MRIAWTLAAAIGAGAVLAGGLVWLDAACPPDLHRLADLSIVVEARDGSMLRAFTNSEGRWRLRTTVADVPAHYIAALKAYEDRRFDSHFGVDPVAVVRAAGQNLLSGRVVSGASTLTMQVARLLEPRPRTLRSKLIEAARAAQLEWRFDKREILDMYLTLAPFGGPVEGVRAASLAWFGKPPRALTPSEAVLLVALPQAPSNLRPDRWPERARAARDKVVARIADTIATHDIGHEAIPAVLRHLPVRAAHLADTLRRQHRTRPTIRTTIDPALQHALEGLVRREDGVFGEKGSVAAVVVDNASRTMLAYVGGVAPFDAARAGYVDLVRARRSPGSVLKPFLYGLAFDDRIVHPGTLVADVPTRFGEYKPDNFDGQFRGDLTVRDALQRSLNIPAVAVLQEFGPLRFTHALQRAGARLAFPRGIERPRLPVVLGGMAISLGDVAMLYAGLASGGKVAPLRAVPGASAEPVALLSPAAAQEITDILRGTPPPPGSARLFSRRTAAIAYKTGTSFGFRDAWAAGYTPTHTVAIWVGRPDGTPMPGSFGRETAAPLLFRIFDLLPEAPTPAIVGAGSAPPPALRRFSVGDALREPAALADPDRLEILFPPEGATLDRGSGEVTVPLRAGGGQRPLQWLVDGRPVESTAYHREVLWQPDGPGFFRATVVDARGMAKSVEFRVR